MSYTDFEIPDSLSWKRQGNQHEDVAAEWSGDDDVNQNYQSDEVESEWDATGSMPFRLTHAVLAICLNLGTPQGIRTKTEEAFFDPSTRQHERSMRKIMNNLVECVENLQKLSILALPDPRSETVIAALQRARRECKDQQMMFLYNDHGTLAPTEQGEVWVYDTDFPTTPTTYNPVFVSALMDVALPGTIYIWDCDNAGKVLDSAIEHAKRRDRGVVHDSVFIVDKKRTLSYLEHDVHFCATAHKQVLPTAEGLPRDVFTVCMLSPLAMALRHHLLVDDLRLAKTMVAASPPVNPELLMNIPGQLNQRDTPLGEMNWLLMAILETIAFQSLPLKLFRKLFRSNSGLAGLARGFILAQRVLRQYDCTPVSYPAMPSTHLHPLWQVWDTAVDDFLCQLPIPEPSPGQLHVYRSPKLLSEQLFAFSAQLTLFSSQCNTKEGREKTSRLCANSLPIVFFAAAGGPCRLLALTLLVRYLDIGGCVPVRWSFACGIDQLRARMLHWDSSEEASQVAFIFQRLMLSDQGPPLLGYYNTSTARTTLSAFTAMLGQHNDGGDSSWSADTFAGVLYMMSIAADQPDFDSTLIKEDRWMSALMDGLKHADCLVRQWSLLLLASMWPYETHSDDQALQKVMDLVVDRASDDSEATRLASLYALWRYFDCKVYGRAGGSSRSMMLRAAARVFAVAQTDASLMARRLLLTCIDCLQEKRPYWLILSPWCYMATRVKDDGDEALEHECSILLQACLHCCEECADPELTAERLAALEAMCNAVTRLCDDPDTQLATLARAVYNKASTSARHSSIGKYLPRLRKRLEYMDEIIDDLVDLDPEGKNKTTSVASSMNGDDKLGDFATETSGVGGSARYTHLLAAIRLIVHEHHDPSKPVVQLTNDLGKRIHKWRKSMERYFHLPRLIWMEKKFSVEELKALQKIREGRHAALESESRADKPWAVEKARIGIETAVNSVRFHSFETIIAATQRRRTIFYNLDDVKSSIKATAPIPSRWGDLLGTRFLNEQHDVDTIMQTTNEGVRNELSMSTKLGSIVQWNLLDARRVRKHRTTRMMGITCLDYEKERGFLFAAGYADGALELFDQRQSRKSSVAVWDANFKSKALSCHLTTGQEIVSIHANGSINVWDLRVPNQPISTNHNSISAEGKTSIAATGMDSVSLFAQISLYPPDTAPELSISRVSFPAPVQTSVMNVPGELRPGDRACLAFHPNSLIFAIATPVHETDSTVVSIRSIN